MFKKLLMEFRWKWDMFQAKRKNPNAGFFTLMCLAAGYTLQEIDAQIKENEKWYGFKDGLTIHEKREEHCEVEVSYWEE
ncbi:hypothetical protein [Cytobacillus praedii]|uniref:hypothetical protein n=1 Tax=Cytobacillus praedii TaxID=1742358 RepID=UPI002E23D0A9|nr:hypothetical protein [Cytobacillus praedii]